MKSIKKWQVEAHRLAREKGWYSPPKSDLECLMLMVSELSEAAEEIRKGTPYIYQVDIHGDRTPSFGDLLWDKGLKPEGELIELADVVLRILDYCESKGLDLEQALEIKHDYNRTRGQRHGGKKF